jgi:hypothetical protein
MLLFSGYSQGYGWAYKETQGRRGILGLGALHTHTYQSLDHSLVVLRSQVCSYDYLYTHTHTYQSLDHSLVVLRSQIQSEITMRQSRWHGAQRTQAAPSQGGGLLISHSFSPTEIPLPFNCFSDLRQAPTAALARSDSVSLPIAIPYRYDPTRLRKLDIGFVRSLLRVVTRVVVAVSP